MSLDFQTIYDFIVNNFLAIIICIGLVGIAFKLANMIIKIVAIVLCALLCIKIFFLR